MAQVSFSGPSQPQPLPSSTPRVAPTPPVQPQQTVQPIAPQAQPQAAPQGGVQAPPQQRLATPEEIRGVQGRIQTASSTELAGRVQQLKDTTFSNSISKFFHKAVGSDTYNAYRAQKQNMRDVSAIQTEARQLAATGRPADTAQADRLMSKADLLGANRSPQLNPQQQAAYTKLDGTPEGRQMLESLGLPSSQKMDQLRANGSQTEISQLAPAFRTQFPGFSQADTAACESLKTHIQAFGPDTGAGILFDRSSVSASYHSHLLEQFVAKEFSSENVNFLKAARDLSAGEHPPSVADLRNLVNTYVRGDAPQQVNLNDANRNDIVRAMDQQPPDYAGVVRNLGKAMSEISGMMQNDSLSRLKDGMSPNSANASNINKFKEAHAAVPAPIRQEYERHQSIQSSLRTAGLLGDE